MNRLLTMDRCECFTWWHLRRVSGVLGGNAELTTRQMAMLVM